MAIALARSAFFKTNMNDTVSQTSATNPLPIPSSEFTPCVRYGFPEDSDNPHQAPTLKPIDAPVPDEAETASPVYLLTDEQYEHHESKEEPYRVENASCIATALQDECEQANRVVYPIYIETDAFPEMPFEESIRHMGEFLETELSCPVQDCTFYFSGNRSIHAHVPRVVTTESERERLKEMATQFSDEAGAKFDLGIYSRKGQFRLPGVPHQKTGLPKVEVQPEWEHDRIFQEATRSTPGRPQTYAEVLSDVFRPVANEIGGRATSTDTERRTLLQTLASDEAVIILDDAAGEVDCPLIEQEEHPTDSAKVREWAKYNYHQFSPYAHAGDNARSVAVIQVAGGAFARAEKRSGATMVPAYFYGARGCNGDEYTKADEHAPLQLSDRDFEKWNYSDGDHVVIIGGQSRSSRIFRVESWEATVAGHALTGESGSREAALRYLKDEGYHVGEPGRSDARSASDNAETRGGSNNIPSVAGPTEAAELQQQAEQEGIETLTHEERWRVACRLLRAGWEPAWEWFQSQFGAEFKPDVTREQFQSIIRAYPHDYQDVEVPEDL